MAVLFGIDFLPESGFKWNVTHTTTAIMYKLPSSTSPGSLRVKMAPFIIITHYVKRKLGVGSYINLHEGVNLSRHLAVKYARMWIGPVDVYSYCCQ